MRGHEKRQNKPSKAGKDGKVFVYFEDAALISVVKYRNKNKNKQTNKQTKPKTKKKTQRKHIKNTTLSRHSQKPTEQS